jgi:glycosyltransferase involved in cell wall biosynthesis
MKILLAKSFPKLTSVGVLARELRRRGHDVHALVPSPHSDHESLHRLGIPVHVIDLVPRARGRSGRAARAASILGRTIRVLRAEAFDVVLLNLATARLFGRLAVLGARPTAVVSSIRGFESRHERWSNWIDDATVAVSHAVRRYLVARGVPERKLVTIHNGVAADEPEWAPGDPAYLHRELGLAPQVPVVGMVAYYRDDDLKGHRVFFDAARRLLERAPSVHFVSIGSDLSREGLTREHFERYTRELGIRDRVHFLGERQDIPAILGSLTVHVLPSFSEGCPMAVLEAMAKGVPNVATRLESIAEIVEDGRSGLLIEPDDSDALAAALALLLEHPGTASRLGAAGRERLLAQFGARRMADQYERVFRAVRRRRLAHTRPAFAETPPG